MDRRVVLTVVVGAIVTVLMITVASSDAVPLAERRPSMPFNLPILEFAEIDVDTSEPGVDNTTDEQRDLSSNTVSYLMNLLLLGGVAALIWGARRAWDNRPALAWRPTPPRSDFAVLEEVAAAMVADAAAQRAVLERGEARNAIVACWSRLEDHVTAAGFEPDPADTAADFTERVLAEFAVDPSPIARLATLYREARFSVHAMGEPERATAIASLDEIHAGLRRVTSRTVST